MSVEITQAIVLLGKRIKYAPTVRIVNADLPITKRMQYVYYCTLCGQESDRLPPPETAKRGPKDYCDDCTDLKTASGLSDAVLTTTAKDTIP